MSVVAKWYEVTVKFSSEHELLISTDDAEKMFQAVREALKPFVDPKQLDISQVKPAFVSHEGELRACLLMDLKTFQHVTNKGYANLRSDTERVRSVLGLALKAKFEDAP